MRARLGRTGLSRREGGASALRFVALVLVADVVIAAAGAVATATYQRPSSVSQAISTAEMATRNSDVAALLARRADAVLHRDKQEFLAGIDPDEAAFVQRQSSLFDNLAAVPLASWTYVLTAAQEDPARPQALSAYNAPVWVPQVELKYAIRGFDSRPSLISQKFTFVKRSAGWLIASDSDFDSVGPGSGRSIWDFGPVVVVKGRYSLVLSHPGQRTKLPALAVLADDAVMHVSEVWGNSWSRRVVLIVPDSQSELSALLGQGGDLSQIAAVAVAQTGDAAQQTDVGDRVIVNPANFSRLSDVGRHVVLRHEVTHVASRSVTGAITPSWLVEGFADYVGYRDVGLSVPVIAHELLGDIRSGRTPQELPTDADFLTSAPNLAQAYEMAWLACRLIARTYGEAQLVRFYRAVGTSRRGTEEAALQVATTKVLGISFATFQARWRSDIARELR